MLVRELIEQLQQLPPDLLVILQRDPEGNGYSPASGVEEALYDPHDRGWQVYSEQDAAEECPDAVPCAVLWPKY